MKTSCFRQTKHKVHILDGLSRRSLDQVVDTANDNEISCPVVNSRVNKTKVVPLSVLGMGREVYHFDKGLILLEVHVKLPQFFSSLFVDRNGA